jgi:putative oxygen-independent coproporphyrinogen III oxidase
MASEAAIGAAASSGLASLAADAAELAAERDELAPLAVSLYVHVPFCVSKCAYCDFTSQAVGPTPASGLGAPFVDAVLAVLDRAAGSVLRDVPTVYLGGGTPTVLGDELVRLAAGVRELAGVRADAEITVETNPETTSDALIAALVAAGVNRFSLGAQSFDDAVLRTLGRAHDVARAEAACEVLAGSGVPFSIDLMCGIPGQTRESWAATLERALGTGATHFSVYPLSLEEGTPLEAAVRDGRLPAPDPDLAADMMLMARDRLADHCMRRYEVANYAQPGHESRHNLVYWTGGAYVGVGPSAASMLPASASALLDPRRVRMGAAADSPDATTPGARVRFTMNDTLADFVRGGWDRMPVELEVLSERDAAREDVMLGMRLTSGVTAGQVDCAGLTTVMASLEEQGLVERFRDADDVEGWRTTDRGWLLGNEVFGAIWAG